MPQRSKPIFQKVSKLLKVAILRRPIIPKIKLVMKSRRRVKKLKLLRYSNYGFLPDHYQFSPSSTSLIRYISSRRRRSRSVKNSGFRRVCQLLFLSRCVSRLKDEGVLDTSRSWIEALPPNVIEVACPARELSEPFDYDSSDESIDQRAERFIERFYEEMRMQRPESN